jgi:hypothetical protein
MCPKQEVTLLEHLPKDGPPEFVIRAGRGLTIVLDVKGVRALQGAACDFLLAHSPLVLRDGTPLPRTVAAHFDMPPKFLEKNIPASAGH